MPTYSLRQGRQFVQRFSHGTTASVQAPLLGFSRTKNSQRALATNLTMTF